MWRSRVMRIIRLIRIDKESLFRQATVFLTNGEAFAENRAATSLERLIQRHE